MTYCPVVSIAPNPVLDLIFTDEDYEFSGKCFHKRFGIHAGGAGVVVARALRQMGITAKVFSIFRGRTGSLTEQLLAEEGISYGSVRGPGVTRAAAFHYGPNERRMLVGPTPSVDKASLSKLVEKYSPYLSHAKIIFFGASFPNVKWAQDMIVDSLAPYADRLVMDTRQHMLVRMLELEPLCAKVDSTDFLGVAGSLDGLERLTLSALRLRSLKSRTIFLTERIRHLYTVCSGQLVKYPALRSLRPNEYGRGDVFCAGVIFGLVHRYDLDVSIRIGLQASSCSLDKRTLAVGTIAEGMFKQRLKRLRLMERSN